MKPKAPIRGRVAGRVTAAENRAPLAGASLKLKGTKLETRADAGGAFELSDVPPGRYQVEPLVDAAGVLRARGIVNTREHLESLLEAMDLGVGSIQEFAQRSHTGS